MSSLSGQTDNVEVLKREIEIAGKSLVEIEDRQKMIIQTQQSEIEAKTRLTIETFSKFVENIQDIEKLLIVGKTTQGIVLTEQSTAPEGEVLEKAGLLVTDTSTTAAISFSQLEDRLGSAADEIMHLEEDAAQYRAGVICSLRNKITQEKQIIEKKIAETMHDIKNTRHEQHLATDKRGHLHNQEDQLNQTLAHQRVLRGIAIGGTTGGSVVGAVGVVLCVFFPPVGIPMLLAGAAAAAGSGATFSENEQNLVRTREKLENAKHDVHRIDQHLNYLQSKVPGMEHDIAVLEGLVEPINGLGIDSHKLDERARRHLDAIQKAKGPVSMARIHMAELNAHMQSDYRDSRDTLASSLELIVQKLGATRQELLGPKYEQKIETELLALIRSISKNTEKVLAIMDKRE